MTEFKPFVIKQLNMETRQAEELCMILSIFVHSYETNGEAHKEKRTELATHIINELRG